ncbi:hypothetical protein [Streptomyces siamensis]|uniref:Uncharacterized protein n=1 Tax=Streptomyces siamensis TaxID=1274986 RepID=A0ABP9JC40_9ACTN
MSETGLGYDVFAPLWAILEIGAVRQSGTRPLRDVSLADFVAGRRREIDRLLELIRVIGEFRPETMAIFETQGGWKERREVTAAYLSMYSGCIEGYPPDTDDPVVLRRMVHMGGDLQLTTLLNALVGAASVRDSGPEAVAPLVVDTVRTAGSLLDADLERVASDTFRMWRVSFLPDVLRPDSPAEKSVKAGLRAYAHVLEDLIDPYP